MSANLPGVRSLSVAAPLPLLLVGCGHMGRSLLAGWRGAGLAPGATVVADRNLARHAPTDLPHCYPGVASALDRHAGRLASVVLAVRPADVLDVATALRGRLAPGIPVLSVAAGVRLGAIREALGPGPRLYRVMPNMPVSVAEGCLACIAEEPGDASGHSLVEALLSPLGELAWLRGEQEIDAVTALSGSGPAYLYALVEAMAAGGERLGLDRGTADLLALQTALGAVKLASRSGDAPRALRDAVASPGGTTDAALSVLLGDGGLEPLVENAMAAACQRASILTRAPN